MKPPTRVTLWTLLTVAMLAIAQPAFASESRPPPPSEPGFFGVLLQVVDDDVARAVGLDHARGAFVARVMNDSPADLGGVRDGDVILEIDGDRVADRSDCIRRIATTRPGTRVHVTVFRDGDETVVDVTVGRRPEALAGR